MSTLTFSYRSKKPKTFLEARLSFRLNGENLNPKTGKEMPFSFYTRSDIEVTKDFWKAYQKGTSFKDVDKINLKKEIDDGIYNLRTHVISQFKKTKSTLVNKQWFNEVVTSFYHPELEENIVIIPYRLIEYFDYYLKSKEHDMSVRLVSKYNVVKNKLERFNSQIQITNVNEVFKKEFIEWCKSERYSNSTIDRDLKYVKTVVRHARLKGVEVSDEVEGFTIKCEKTHKIYLTFDELKKIGELDNLPNHLLNARDWLLISCYTGQRISDFMRFDKSMLRIENNVPLLEFTQVKTGVDMSIPVLPEVMKVLDKTNGEFPRKISDQKYNEYIKKVCMKAKINHKERGKISLNISENKNKTVMRKVLGDYPKWKLVTSHIGRRSFATNYYGKLPTTFLIGITGHSTERMFLSYIGKGQKDLAFDAYEYFINMNNK